jgi:hypothetical protein
MGGGAEVQRYCFTTPSHGFKWPVANPGTSVTMNRFDLQYWEGARESALAIYEYVNERKDVPDDVRAYVTRVLKESGERKNKGFREELQLPAPPKATQKSR